MMTTPAQYWEAAQRAEYERDNLAHWWGAKSPANVARLAELDTAIESLRVAALKVALGQSPDIDHDDEEVSRWLVEP